MHLRASTIQGLPIYESETPHSIASIVSIVIDPDSARIEGFFVKPASWFVSSYLFLPAIDILAWHKSHLDINSGSSLAPIEEYVRLNELVAESRPIIGQPIITEDNFRLGKCRDVQFKTQDMYTEWMFPYKFWRWQIPISTSEIIEVKPNAIIVKSHTKLRKALSKTDLIDPLAVVSEAVSPTS